MEEKQVQQILEELKQAYPMYEISTQSTQQRGNRYLVIIKGFDNIGNIDDWSVDVVYPIFWEMQKILEKYEGTSRNLRLIFIRNREFVLYSPDVGMGNVFREMKKPLHIDVYGDHERQHYVGECRDINDVLDYLTTTHVWF